METNKTPPPVPSSLLPLCVLPGDSGALLYHRVDIFRPISLMGHRLWSLANHHHWPLTATPLGHLVTSPRHGGSVSSHGNSPFTLCFWS